MVGGHDQTTFFALCLCVSFFFALAFLALVGYCSAVPLQLGAESERAPSPAPVPCVCHLSNSQYFSFFFLAHAGSPPLPPQQNHLGGPALDGPGAFSFWSVALHTCTIVFVCRGVGAGYIYIYINDGHTTGGGFIAHHVPLFPLFPAHPLPLDRNDFFI
jgi:hypothetical protein